MKTTYLIDDPGTVEMPILRWLPPAESSGTGAGLHGDFQGNVSPHVARVAEEELLEKAPCETSIERILQQYRLASGVWHPLTASQSHEELHKPNSGRNHCKGFFSSTSYTANWRDKPHNSLEWVSLRRPCDFRGGMTKIHFAHVVVCQGLNKAGHFCCELLSV